MPMEVAHASILPEPFPRLPQPLDETASLAHKKMRSSRASPEDAIIWLKPTMYERGVTEKRLVFVFFFFFFYFFLRLFSFLTGQKRGGAKWLCSIGIRERCNNECIYVLGAEVPAVYGALGKASNVWAYETAIVGALNTP